jgi:transcriptional regulator with XRE-family HTH domain
LIQDQDRRNDPVLPGDVLKRHRASTEIESPRRNDSPKRKNRKILDRHQDWGSKKFDIERGGFQNANTDEAWMMNADEIEEWDAVFRRNLGPRILEARLGLGLSQVELARRLCVEASRLSYWEKGANLPSLPQAARIAIELQVGLEELALGKAPSPRAEVGFTLRQYERLRLGLRTAMEAVQNEEQQRGRRPLPGAPKQGSISSRRSR